MGKVFALQFLVLASGCVLESLACRGRISHKRSETEREIKKLGVLYCTTILSVKDLASQNCYELELSLNPVQD
jgi:hypothetical protein